MPPAPVQPAHVLLVRHGQSVWNAEGRWQGHADPPLSPLGIEQARAAAPHLGAVGAIVASDLQRARATAELFAAELGIGPVLVDTRLRERDAGEWTGLTRADIDAAFPGYLTDGRRPPGFETGGQVVERALEVLRILGNGLGGEPAVAVTHGGVIRSLERHLGVPDDGLVPNLGGRWFGVVDDRVVAGDRVLLLEGAGVTVTRPQQL